MGPSPRRSPRRQSHKSWAQIYGRSNENHQEKKGKKYKSCVWILFCWGRGGVHEAAKQEPPVQHPLFAKVQVIQLALWPGHCLALAHRSGVKILNIHADRFFVRTVRNEYKEIKLKRVERGNKYQHHGDPIKRKH